METENRNKLIQIIIAAVLLAVAFFIEKKLNLPAWQLLLIYLLPYLIVGYETLKEAAESIAHGEALDEDFLMSVATIGALVIGFLPGAETCFPEAVFVMLFFQIGEFFEEMAEDNCRRSISHLMDIRPDYANLVRGEEIVRVNPDELKVGDCIIIKPGEKVPVDGEVIEGTSSLDTSAMTGESVPTHISLGDGVLSGCVNITGVIRVKVCRLFGESTASKVLELVENAAENKSSSEKFITKFAKVYTPIVVIAAFIIAILPPLLSGNFMASFSTWLYRAMTFLVISCPCALVISVPLTFFGGLGAASRRGILIKGSNYIDKLAKLDTVVFDKTGTLTEGVFKVTAIHPEKLDERGLLHLAAHVERFSSHPIAISLKEAYMDENDGCDVSRVTEEPGLGISAYVNGKNVIVGNSRMMDVHKVNWHPCEKSGTIVHVAVEGEYEGHIVISDKLRADSPAAVKSLIDGGVRRIVMLTGDKEEVAASVAKELGISQYKSELLPAGKVSEMEKLMQCKSDNGSLAFVGDGVNDAPVLALSDVGIAMGGLGSDAAIEAADVVLMDDKPSKIAIGVKIAKKTLKLAVENVVFAIGVKLIVLVLSALGFAPMWLAVFADVGVTVLAVLNAMRMLKD